MPDAARPKPRGPDLLPDFSSLFRREVARPLRFRSRRGSNHSHDVLFLSSYLHDARFKPSDITRRGKSLSIAVERDCWELGYTDHAEAKELHIARSRLTVGPVESIAWHLADPSVLDQELWIESIYLGPPHWETPEASEINISAPHAGWKLTISIADDYADIRLIDREKPWSYSSRIQ